MFFLFRKVFVKNLELKIGDIENIIVKSIVQKSNWIIAKTEDDNCEYRFRVKDVEMIEYKN